MMAVDVKQLSDVGRAWLDEHGKPINVDRAWEKSEKTIAKRTLGEAQLAAASLDVAGERRWYALRTGHRGEVELCKVLTDSRVDAVVPIKSVPLKRRCRGVSRKVIHKPVLAGLVFVNLVPSDVAFSGLLHVRRVVGLVGTSKDRHQPYPIGERQMNSFMDLAQKGAFDERNTPTGLKVGSAVRIAVGPYAEFCGILEGYAKGRSARVMTWLFGQELIVDVKLAHLEKSE